MRCTCPHRRISPKIVLQQKDSPSTSSNNFKPSRIRFSPTFKGLPSESEYRIRNVDTIRNHKQEINTVPNQRGGFKIMALVIVTSILYYCHVIITSMPNTVIVSVSNNNKTTMQFLYSRADAFGLSMHSGVNAETKVSEI